VTGGGDFNGDGLVDLGRVALFIGGPDGPSQPFLSFEGVSFGRAAGDTNGDGFSDVIAGVSSTVSTREAKRVYLGGAVGCDTPGCSAFVPLVMPGHRYDDEDGPAASATGSAGLGDVNGDDYGDIAFFTPGAGTVHLFLGGPAGPDQEPSLTIAGEQGFGFCMAQL
jgi:hypothetical protein